MRPQAHKLTKILLMSKVLFVDDEQGMRELFNIILTSAKYEVIFACDGKEAWEILQKQNDIELVVSDIRMPEMTGVELLTEIRNRHPINPPVILMSAHSDLIYEQSFNLGAAQYFKKPCNTKEFLALVKDLLSEKPRHCKTPNNQIEIKATISFDIKSISEALANKKFGLGIGGFSFKISLLDTHLELLAKEFVEFNITISEGEFLNINGVGEICWINKETIGVKFICLPETIETSILNYVLKNNIKSYIPVFSN